MFGGSQLSVLYVPVLVMCKILCSLYMLPCCDHYIHICMSPFVFTKQVVKMGTDVLQELSLNIFKKRKKLLNMQTDSGARIIIVTKR